MLLGTKPRLVRASVPALSRPPGRGPRCFWPPSLKGAGLCARAFSPLDAYDGSNPGKTSLHDAGMPLRIYRRRLPHWRLEGSTYFVTWCLHRTQSSLRAVEREMVQRVLRHFEGMRFDLRAFVVMDDHVHVVVTPMDPFQLECLVHSWKSYSAWRLQREMGRKGAVWQDEYHDRIDDAAELDEAEEVRRVILVPRDQSPEVLEPRKQPLDVPPAVVAPQRPAVLCGWPAPVAAVRGDQSDPALGLQAVIQGIAVIRLVTNQSGGDGGREACVEGRVDQRDFVGRSARDADGERKTSAVCHCHDLGPFAPLGVPDVGAPFLAPAKVPSMKPSLRSRPPRSARSAASARSSRSQVPARTHCWNRRWHVW